MRPVSETRPTLYLPSGNIRFFTNSVKVQLRSVRQLPVYIIIFDLSFMNAVIFGVDLSSMNANFFQSGNRCKTIHSHNKLWAVQSVIISIHTEESLSQELLQSKMQKTL